MSETRILLDTVFIQALFNRRDQYHEHAKALLPEIREAREVWVTEAVLVEVGNALGSFDKSAAVRFIRQCYATENIYVVPVDTPLLMDALDLYAARPTRSGASRTVFRLS